jgi:hypothetical protein
MQQIAQEIIELKRRMDEIKHLYNVKRDEMYNALTNAALSTFECNGYRFQRTDESAVSTIKKERLFLAMAGAGLCESVQQQIFLAACLESVRPPGVRVVEIASRRDRVVYN